ncbi:glycosyltransferase family 2 protein [Microseira wollei]|uniref:Glycosyl transferase family 2 n=1 Tax=Microseira wollei NIES-4236 TaxID=2530354 RepID=A0AAV3X8I3_9CYAN|nr:glycosyltransferase family A protein [Microseira wollei]GET35682.1 glycosyl transferase family 2 [Microseira wollei NIES-4236]
MANYLANDNDHLVSVIIPAYNAERFIERTLKSVLAQTYHNLEVIVVDDGSQDRTAQIVQSIAQEDRRVRLLQQPNAGVAAARNLGIQKSRGEFVAPIDADDIWYPQNIEKQVKCIIESDSSVGLVYSWSVDINEDDFLTGGFHASEQKGKVYLPLLCRNFIGNGSAVLIRRTCLEKVGGYNNEQLKDEHSHGSEDWELYLRIAESYQFGVVPEFLIGYRKTSLSTSYKDASMVKFYELLMQMVRQKHPEIPEQIYHWSGSNFYLYLAYQSFHSSKHSNSLAWLYKSLQLDLSMTLLRHDIYILTLKNLYQIFIQYIKSGFLSKHFYHDEIESSYTKKTINLTLNDMYKLVKFRELVPYKLYEKYRFQKLDKN